MQSDRREAGWKLEILPLQSIAAPGRRGAREAPSGGTEALVGI
jgi:hypothetical protein